MEKAGIYKITSPSGRIYIGQSWTIKKRWSHYKKGIKPEQRHIFNSLQKYGWEAHTFEIVHELPKDATQEVMDIYEILYVKQYRDCGFKMMNIREPGSKGKMSEESKKRMSIAQIGNRNASKPRTKEQNLAMSLRSKGRIISKTILDALHKNNQKAICEINAQGITIREWESIKIAADYYNISAKGVSDMCNNRKKSFKNFSNKFKFK